MSRSPCVPKSFLLALGVAAVLPALGAAQDSMPARKAGLWETTMAVGPEGRSIATMMCTDETLEKRFSPLRGGPTSGMTGDCKDMAVHRTLSGVEMEGTCTSNGHVSHMKGKVTGDFSTTYVMDMQLERDGKPLPPMHIAAKWVGPCGEYKAGDMIIAGRVVGNMSNLANVAGARR